MTSVATRTPHTGLALIMGEWAISKSILLKSILLENATYYTEKILYDEKNLSLSNVREYFRNNVFLSHISGDFFRFENKCREITNFSNRACLFNQNVKFVFSLPNVFSGFRGIENIIIDYSTIDVPYSLIVMDGFWRNTNLPITPHPENKCSIILTCDDYRINNAIAKQSNLVYIFGKIVHPRDIKELYENFQCGKHSIKEFQDQIIDQYYQKLQVNPLSYICLIKKDNGIFSPYLGDNK